MDIVTIDAAKTNFSQRLTHVEAGEEIVLARGKHPIAKLVPFQPPSSKQEFGNCRGPQPLPVI